MKKHVSPLLILALFANVALAEPCVSTPMQLQAAQKQFEQADLALNLAWKQLKSTLSAPSYQETLKQQRLWIPYRDEMAAATAAGEPFVEAKAMTKCAEFQISRAEITSSRTKVLRALALPAPTTWSGIYEDSFGGQISIDERKDGLHFLIDVVRSSAFHTGRIVGIAQRNPGAAGQKQQAVFRTTTDDYSTEAEDTLPVVVTLDRNGALLQVSTENAENFGGMRAYFDGSYVRVAALDKKGVAELDDALSGADQN